MKIFRVKMMLILTIYQDVITTCYLGDTTVIYDVNTNLVEVNLVRNNTFNKHCYGIDKRVRVNITINSPKNNKIPLVKATVRNFSYADTNQIIIYKAFDHVVDFNIIYYIQVDIYTFGRIISVKTVNFLIQQSNLQECYFSNSFAIIFRNRVEITLYPTGICQLQMLIKSTGFKNYLESVYFQINNLKLQLNLKDFEYKQVQQILIFHGNLIDITTQNPFLQGRIVFNSNQEGNIISFSQEILDMRLSTIPDFITKGEVGMWNQKFYIKLAFDDSKYQDYLKQKGVQTQFKMSVEIDRVVYSFSQINNKNIKQQEYIVIDCKKQLIQLQENCYRLVRKQQYGRLNLDIISVNQDISIASMYKISLLQIQTCWNRAFATRQGNQFKIDLYNNKNCDIKQGQLKLFNANNDLVLEEAFVNNTYQHVYHGDFESELYTMVLESNGEQYSIVIDKIKHIKADYATILAVTVGSCFIIYCLILFVTTTISLITRRKRNRQKKQVKF